MTDRREGTPLEPKQLKRFRREVDAIRERSVQDENDNWLERTKEVKTPIYFGWGKVPWQE